MEITKLISEPQYTSTGYGLRLTQDRIQKRNCALPCGRINETKPEVGDGDEGGGVVLGDVPWGEQALCTAHQVLRRLDGDVKLYAFRINVEGIYIRLDNPSKKFGFPSQEDINSFTALFMQQFEEMQKSGEVEADLFVQVTFPGLNRPLKVPEELLRFKKEPMRVWYLEGKELKRRIFKLVSIDTEAEEYVWRLVNVMENEDLFCKGKHWSAEKGCAVLLMRCRVILTCRFLPSLLCRHQIITL